MFRRFFVLILLSAILFVLAHTVAHATPDVNFSRYELLEAEVNHYPFLKPL